MPSINIHGTDYELSTRLRVAYKVQGQHNHKPYTEIFANVGKMGVQDQIGILFAAFEAQNEKIVCEQIPRLVFTNAVLDTYNLKEMMDLLQEVIAGMMGTDPENLSKPSNVDSGEQQTDPLA